MITVDGAFGEGGGQILRTALALSLAMGEGFRIYNIRANRKRPGLRSQHLAAVRAAAAVGQADVQGDRLGSSDLTFRPEAIKPGEYIFDIGTAGSTTLVLQTVLPALVTAPGPSALVLRGGTHNPFAPPFDFFAIAFVPLINRMGPKLRAKLDRYGFYPAGGGKMRVTVEPRDGLQPLDLPVRGNIERCCCRAVVAGLPRHIAERELKVLKRKLPVKPNDSRIEEISSNGPGNVVIVTMTSAEVSDVVTGFGEKGVRAEVVAERNCYGSAALFSGRGPGRRDTSPIS